jgi:hypothetical protein
MRIEQIYPFQCDLEDLSEEIDGFAIDFNKVINLLNSISRLQNIQNFSNIGEEAAEWESYTRKNDEQSSFYSYALSGEEQGDLAKQVQNWIFEYKRALDEIVAISTDADLPADKLSQGPHAFLDIQLGEGYKSEYQDLQEACGNLLCGTYTSDEIMSLRTIESLLRKWYKSEMDENPGKMNWHNVFGALEDSEDADEFQGMEYLDLLRERRNKVVHPDEHSDRREAELTLKRTFDITEKIIGIIEEMESS